MRRISAVLAIAAATCIVGPATAGATTTERRCANAGAPVNGKNKTLATKIRVRSLDCEIARKFWVSFAAGKPGPRGTGALRKTCKVREAAAEEKAGADSQGRVIYACKRGKVWTTAWILPV